MASSSGAFLAGGQVGFEQLRVDFVVASGDVGDQGLDRQMLHGDGESDARFFELLPAGFARRQVGVDGVAGLVAQGPR